MAIYTVKALITDPIDEILIKTLREKGIQVDYMPEISKEELLNIIGNYDIIVVRSRTKVTKDVIEKGKKYYVYAKIDDDVIPIGFKTFYTVNKNGTLAIGLPKNLLDWTKIKKITLIVQLS